MSYVLFSDSAIRPATNAEQWYVSISRGRRGVRIFTPDKAQLLQSGHRKLAIDLAAGRTIAHVQTHSISTQLSGAVLKGVCNDSAAV